MGLSFNKWLDVFLEEKGIDVERMISVSVDNRFGVIEIKALVEFMKNSNQTMKKRYKKILIILDFKNVDIVQTFFTDLAKSLI